MKIIIVDDNKTFLEKLEKILSLERHEITSALSGREALKILSKKNNFDLLLTDLKMGEMSGIDLIKELKIQGHNLVSIVITGYGTIDSAVEAMRAGAFDYLLKPFEIASLRDKLNEVENELTVRKDIFFPKGVSEPIIEDEIDQIRLEECEKPFLVFSDEEPGSLVQGIAQSDITFIQLGFNNGKDTIAPSKLGLIRQKIEVFVNTQEKGTIIFQGMETLLQMHNWIYIKRFIESIRQEILSSNFSIVIYISEDRHSTDRFQPLLHDALSLLSIQSFESIIDIISHPLRKNIINLLNSQGKFNYNKMLEKLEIKSSSNLAFHVKKLVIENILEKDENQYDLTERGHYIGEIINLLEKIGLFDPNSRVKVLKHNKKEDKSKFQFEHD